MFKHENLYNMELEIVKNLEITLEREGNRLKDDATLSSFKQASLEFDKLVQKGMVKRRGYTLMTIDDKHLNHFLNCTNLFK